MKNRFIVLLAVLFSAFALIQCEEDNVALTPLEEAIGDFRDVMYSTIGRPEDIPDFDVNNITALHVVGLLEILGAQEQEDAESFIALSQYLVTAAGDAGELDQDIVVSYNEVLGAILSSYSDNGTDQTALFTFVTGQGDTILQLTNFLLGYL